MDPMDTDKPVVPGDNPNTRNAKKSRKFRPKKTSRAPVVQNMFESVDPGVGFTDPRVDGSFVDVPRPGNEIIGKITLRKNFVKEFIELADSVVEGCYNASKVANPPDPQGLAKFYTYYVLASQGFKTLEILSKQAPIYKLKALLHAQINVPTFMANILSNIGDFKTKQGAISIRSLNQLVPNYAIAMLKAWNEIPGVRTAGTDINVPTTGRGLNRVNRFGFWNSTSIVDDLNAYVEMYFPEVLGPVTIRIDANTTLAVTVDWMNNFQDTLSLINNQQLSIMPDNVRARRVSYLTLAMSDFRNWNDNNMGGHRTQLNIFVGDTDGNPSLRAFVDCVGMVSGYYAATHSRAVETVFMTEVFKPASMGTSSQFVMSSDEDVGLTAIDAVHPYPISESSAKFGLALVPSKKVEICPEYSTHSMESRISTVTKYSDAMTKNN